MNIIKQIILASAIIYVSLFTGCGGVTGGAPAAGVDDGLSSDYLLKNLTFSAGTLRYQFNPDDWTNYLEVPYTNDSITITASSNNKWSEIYIGEEKLQDNVPSNPVSLSIGMNTIQIRVVAEDRQEQVYIIYVIRCSENYSVATLSELTIDGATLSPAFDAAGTNRNFSARTTSSTIALRAVATAQSEGATVEITANDTAVNDPGAISLNPGVNTIKVKGIAPDKRTTETYTITIVLQTESKTSSKLAVLSVAGGNLDPAFNPDTRTYAIDVTSTMNPVNLTAVAESVNATVSITVNDTAVSNPSSIPLPPGVKSTISVIVTAASGGDSTTYTINANALQGSDNANLSGITVMMGTKSYRPIYPGTFTSTNPHNPNITAFDKNTAEYTTVIYGFSSIKITATAEDGTVKSIQFAADGEPVSSSMAGGVGTATIQLKYGLITKIDITVLAGDSATQKVYTIYAKLLNIDEFYWGIYAPSFDKSKSTWTKPQPGHFDRKGYVSGRVDWDVTTAPVSTIKLTTYNDGKMDFPYNDGGFIANGTQEAILDGIATKNGWNLTKNPPFDIRTAEGENFATLDYHLRVVKGDPAEVNGESDPAKQSYTNITYMGETNKQFFKTTKPYPFTNSYDWNISWTDGQ